MNLLCPYCGARLYIPHGDGSYVECDNGTECGALWDWRGELLRAGRVTP